MARFSGVAAMLAAARPAWPAAVACLLAAPAPLHAYGPAGHIIAGAAAEPLLCESARERIAALAGDADLADIGLWADRIRSDADYAHAAPWHYMNIADGASIEAYTHASEGDVLWAIEQFRARLADTSLDRDARLEALRFLVHFVADIHQPLHVGRAADRGGNTIDVVHDGETTNLHRFWDTGALALDGEDAIARYVERLEPAARRVHGELERAEPEPEPEQWAEESLMLRPQVYGFDARAPELSRAYVERAESLTRMRLAAAAARIARTLNAIFCP